MKNLHLPIAALALGVLLSANTCSHKGNATDAPLSVIAGSKWELQTLAGTAVKMPSGVEQPYIELDSTGSRISGFAGCNRMTGGFKLSEDSISFPQLVSTRMYCEATQKEENAFLEALKATRTYRIEDGKLVLLGKDEVAELRRVK